MSSGRTLTTNSAGVWKEIASSSFVDQAIWWLNGFWGELEELESKRQSDFDGEDTLGKDSNGNPKEPAEIVWDAVHLMLELRNDGQKKLYGKKTADLIEGCDLDEMQSHVFLEKSGRTMTAMALRKKLKALDIDNNKKMCLLEWLAATYNKDMMHVVNAPQGEIDQAKLDAAKAEMKAADDALATAVAERAEADAAAHAAKVAKEASEAAQKELEEALAALHEEEEKIATKRNKLQATIDGEGGAVKKNKAKNELAQMEAEDPLPLRRAKITQAAAVKKAKKATKAASEAKEHADKQAAEAAAAQEQAEALFRAAEEALKDLMKGGGVSNGKIWWMQRELAEKKKYMPK